MCQISFQSRPSGEEEDTGVEGDFRANEPLSAWLSYNIINYYLPFPGPIDCRHIYIGQRSLLSFAYAPQPGSQEQPQQYNWEAEFMITSQQPRLQCLQANGCCCWYSLGRAGDYFEVRRVVFLDYRRDYIQIYRQGGHKSAPI